MWVMGYADQSLLQPVAEVPKRYQSLEGLAKVLVHTGPSRNQCLLGNDISFLTRQADLPGQEGKPLEQLAITRKQAKLGLTKQVGNELSSQTPAFATHGVKVQAGKELSTQDPLPRGSPDDAEAFKNQKVFVNKGDF